MSCELYNLSQRFTTLLEPVTMINRRPTSLLDHTHSILTVHPSTFSTLLFIECDYIDLLAILRAVIDVHKLT